MGTPRRGRKFNPTAVADQQKKKKSTNTRIKPRMFNIVLLAKMTIFVPTRGEDGRTRGEDFEACFSKMSEVQFWMAFQICV